MPVEDKPVHPRTKGKVLAACYLHEPPPPPPADMPPASYRTFTGEVVLTDPITGCCQIGRKFHGVWVPLEECIGCKSVKDEQYIAVARKLIDDESAKFIRAEQKL